MPSSCLRPTSHGLSALVPGDLSPSRQSARDSRDEGASDHCDAHGCPLPWRSSTSNVAFQVVRRSAPVQGRLLCAGSGRPTRGAESGSRPWCQPGPRGRVAFRQLGEYGHRLTAGNAARSGRSRWTGMNKAGGVLVSGGVKRCLRLVPAYDPAPGAPQTRRPGPPVGDPVRSAFVRDPKGVGCCVRATWAV